MIPLGPFSSRESRALELLARFRFLTRSQLQAFLFPQMRDSPSSDVMTRRVLHSLLSKGLVSRTERIVGGSTGGSAAQAWFITPQAVRMIGDRRLAGGPRRLAPRGTFLLRHCLATAEVALAFEASARDHAGHRLLCFECDWEVAARLSAGTLVPDAYLIYETDQVELHAFVEVDLGTSGSRHFASKISRYLLLWREGSWRRRFGLWPTVLAVAPDEARAKLLLRTTEAVVCTQPEAAAGATEFAFATLAAVRQDPLGPIWQVAGRAGRHRLLEEAR